MTSRRQLLQFGIGALAGLAHGHPRAGQAAGRYPERLVRLIVPYPAGGSSDLMCRVLAQTMGKLWQQQVIIENHDGAAGAIGIELAARQPADGYSFLFGNLAPVVINPLLQKVPYDMQRDFEPLTLVGTGPNVLVINSARPEKNLDEFLAAAKARPGTMSFGSGGHGSLAHLFGEMMNQATHIEAAHIAYRGGGASVNDLLGSHIDMVIAQTLPAMPHIRAGRLRPLAVTGPERFKWLPEVPTFAEKGLPELVAIDSWGLYVRAGTPPEISRRLHDTAVQALADPGLVEKFDEMGVETRTCQPQELARFNQAETDKYRKLIHERNIQPT